MCGRYTGYVEESDELKTIYTAARAAYPDVDLREGEIYPTNTVPLLGVRGGRLLPFPASWGFPGNRGKAVIINARAETAAQRPTFADSFRSRRCIVPTTGYFEWSAEKRKYLFRQPEKKILYLAGLYAPCIDSTRFVVLTTAANESVASVHHRMPVVLEESELAAWVCDMAEARRLMENKRPNLIFAEEQLQIGQSGN